MEHLKKIFWPIQIATLCVHLLIIYAQGWIYLEREYPLYLALIAIQLSLLLLVSLVIIITKRRVNINQ